MGPSFIEESELMKNSKYKLYAANVDKALKNFESINEWPDLISALDKLNKVLQSNTKFQVIPSRIKIGKRLAQCMHPTLPFGVHLKALETYGIIFKSMGTNRLSNELFIYSAGLFPLFSYAAMKVRPSLLSIYETHFVPLGLRLRPAMPGFLSGVLPGYEKNTEHFTRTNDLLLAVCGEVGDIYFYSCIWECLISNPFVRLPASSFILNNFDKKLALEDQSHIMGNNIDKMVNGLIACIEDKNKLVQRNALDLLMVGFPMHNSHLTPDDQIRLVTSALFTLLHSDPALKRRLHGWLLGSDANMTRLAHHPRMKAAKAGGKGTSYFEVFSKVMLVESIKIVLDKTIGVIPFDLRPLTLLISLLDSKEKKEDNIGSIILDDVLFEYFRVLYICSHSESKADTTELMKCANMLFGSLEPRFLWLYMGRLFTKACSKISQPCMDFENPVKRVSSGDPGIVEICALTEYLLDTISLEAYADTSSEHLPNLFLHIVTLLSSNCPSFTALQVAKGLNLCAKILTRVQPIIVGHHNISMTDISDTDPTNSSMANSLQQDSSDLNQNTDTSSIDEKPDLPCDEEPAPVKSDTLLEQCLRQYEQFYVTFIYCTRSRVGVNKDIKSLLDTLKVKNNDEKSKQLDLILKCVIESEEKTNNNESKKIAIDAKDWTEPMKVGSRLLVDLSTLQTFFQSPTNQKSIENDLFRRASYENIELLPEWLKALITCACWFNSAVPLQMVAVTTLLDLVLVCTTAQSLVSTTVSEDGGTPLLIVPLLTPAHLRFMEKNTFIFQVISHWLWNQLKDPAFKVCSAELLHKLHSIFSNNDIVESCISRYITPNPWSSTSALNACRQYISLWHIGREINNKHGSSLAVSDILYRSMIKLLNNLKLPDYDCLKVETQEWLLHSLSRNDLHRIMDPLLSMLLDHSTARLSILHIRPSDENEKDSINGNQDGKDGKKIVLKKGKNSIDSIEPIAEIINTDFDDFYEEESQDLKPLEGNGTEIIRNNSFPNLVQTNKKPFGINEALKLSSLDLLNLSESIFTRVSDGESISLVFANTINHRGSFSSEGISNLANSNANANPFDLVRSWSFPGKEPDNGNELEESTTAEDFFGSDNESEIIAKDIIYDMIDKLVIMSGDVEPVIENSKRERRSKKVQYQSTLTSHSSNIDSLHSHLLLYRNKYDCEQMLYILGAIKNIIVTNPRAFLFSSTTTTLSVRSAILKLLARHRKSFFGKGFSGDLEGCNIKSAMYLEVIMYTCLYFLRSYYPNTDMVIVNQQDLIGNKEVHMSCTDILTVIASELIQIVRENGRSLACYLSDVFTRMKLYKVLLHTIVTNLQSKKYNSTQFSHQVLKFNESYDTAKDRLSKHSESHQKLILSMLILEREISYHLNDTSDAIIDKNLDENKYLHGKLIPQQPLFLTMITKALDIHPLARFTHSHWTTLITSSLPYLGTALARVVTTALKQICHNIEVLSECYIAQGTVSFPPDYSITQMEALTVLCHYCLLDSVSNQSCLAHGGPSSHFNNLTQNFMSNPKSDNAQQDAARKSVLSHLPKIIASVSILWEALASKSERETENREFGSPRIVKQCILDFLSPIAVHHALSFLATLAIVFRQRSHEDSKTILVKLLIGIKAMPIDILVQTLHQVVKTTSNQDVEVSSLELFLNYIQFVPASSLFDSWNSLLQLLKETGSLSPQGQFYLLKVLSQFVHKCQCFSEKKDQKDLQDIVESCVTVAGAGLENTNWLRRNLAVREEEPQITPDKEDKYVDLETDDMSIITEDAINEEKPKKSHAFKLRRVTKKIRQDAEKLQIRAMHQWFMKTFVNESNQPFDSTDKCKSGATEQQKNSTSALEVLAELLAPLLDISFGSQEKERVNNLLPSLMYIVTPYLKNHTLYNATSYFYCSKLLASLSTYSYTRKSWKKEVMELMFDLSFFQMETRSLKHWCVTIDNLMTQEEATFREFMNRVSPQGNSLNIFSSKELEYEQKAQFLKRLAFVIYCGKYDQFKNNMREIQERLADCLKLPSIFPNLHTQVFQCFRVLLLRIGPDSLISLWPIIISEILQVMLLLEKRLSTDNEDMRKNGSIKNVTDSSMNESSWLQVHLAVANVLFLAEQLPADRLTQFQMYRWAFVGEENTNINTSADFIPYITRIATLMDLKYGVLEAVPTPLLTISNQIRDLQELHPFFTAMRYGKYTPLTLSQLEHNLELDFLDIMTPR